MPLPRFLTAMRFMPGLTPGRWILLLFVTACMAAGYALHIGALAIPERFNPWAPLEVAAPPNVLTPYKLSRARSHPAMCRAALSRAGLQYDVLPDRETGAGCGFDNAVRLRAAPVRFGSPLPLSCPMALSFAMWERHTLQPAAQMRFGQRVVAIDSLGSYACRNVNRGEIPTIKTSSVNRSRHATADAWDIAGFTLASGQHITVQRDFKTRAADTARDTEALWLDDLHAGACRYFSGVLGPDYNAVHRDHFHLETGGYGICH